jgi:hypothetical protein
VVVRGELAELHALAGAQEFPRNFWVNRLLAMRAKLGPPFGGQALAHETGLCSAHDWHDTLPSGEFLSGLVLVFLVPRDRD